MDDTPIDSDCPLEMSGAGTDVEDGAELGLDVFCVVPDWERGAETCSVGVIVFPVSTSTVVRAALPEPSMTVISTTQSPLPVMYPENTGLLVKPVLRVRVPLCLISN